MYEWGEWENHKLRCKGKDARGKVEEERGEERKEVVTRRRGGKRNA